MNCLKIILLIALFYQSVSFAEDAFGRKTNALSLYKASYNEIERVRKLVINPNDGLIKGLSDNNTKLYDWVSNYKSSVTGILQDLSSGGDYSVFSRKLESVIAESTNSLSTNSADLIHKKQAIQNIVGAAQKKIVDYSIPGFETQQQHFDNTRAAIFDTIQDGIEANEALFTNLISVQDEFAKIFRQKVRLVLIARGIADIDQKMREIDNVLMRPSIAATFLRPVSAAQSLYTQAYLTLDHARMKIHLQALDKACTQYFGFITSNPDLNAHSVKEQEVIRRTCTNTPKDFETLVNEMYKGDLQKMFADSIIYYRQPIVDKYCREKNAGKFKCDIYAWAGKLNYDDIVALNSKDFTNLTQAWESIAKGGVIK